MSARSPTTYLLMAMVAGTFGMTRFMPPPAAPAAGAGTQSAPGSTSSSTGTAPAGARGSAVTAAAGNAKSAAPPPAAALPEGWSQPLRLYGEFFGRESPEDPKDTDLSHAIAALVPAEHGGYQLDFMVALVPDPVDSEMPAAFDQALEAIQKGFAKSFFLFDRRWLPWSLAASQGSRERLHRETPGLLLFRRDTLVAGDRPEGIAGGEGRDGTVAAAAARRGCSTGAEVQDPETPGAREERCLVGVFLVGETPKRGIHQAAFVEALRLIQGLSPGDGHRRVKVLGPTYSGSIESLRLALMKARADKLVPATLEIVTGSATAIATASTTTAVTGSAAAEARPGSVAAASSQGQAADDRLEQVLSESAGAQVDFWRTVIPDRFLQSAALCKLQEKMSWDLGSVALITEGDTTYGQSLERQTPAIHPRPKPPAGTVEREQCAPGSPGPLDEALILHFPSHVAAIRNASVAAAAGKSQSNPQQAIAIAPQATELDLSLTDQVLGADSLPELSPLTAPSDEQAMADLLAAIGREGIGYVGILATDIKDKLYLAERIHQFSPDVTLFTFDGDLLFAHRKMQASMNGMFVISTFHLFTEGSAGLHGADPGDTNHRRQFTSEIKEGIYHAIRALLNPKTKQREIQRDPVLGWISVTSNGSIWPLLSVEIDRQDLRLKGFHVLALEDPDSDRTGEPDSHHLLISQRADLELLIGALALCGLAWSLRRAAPPWPRAGAAGDKIPAFSSLLSMGLGLLASAGGLLLALEVIEYWRPDVFWVDDYPSVRAGLWQWLYILGLVAAYLYLVWNLAAVRLAARQAPPASRSRQAGRILGWLAAAAAGLAVTWLALMLWFIPGEIEYFELRSRVFSSGLSPVVSLAWLVGALYVWVLLELKRRYLIAWHEVEWPLADSWDPALQGCGTLDQQLRRLVASPAGLRLGTELRLLALAPVDKRLWSALRREFARLRTGKLVWIALPLAMVLALSSLWNVVQPAGETRMYARLFLGLVLVAMLLSALSFRRFWQVWRKLRRILLRVDETPLKPRFKELADQVAWKPMRSFGWQLPRFNSLDLSTRCVEALLHARRPDQPLPEPIDAAFLEELRRGIEQTFGTDAHGTGEEKLASRRKLQALLAQATRALKSPRPEPEAEELLALRVIAYLRYVFAQLRAYLMGGLFPALLLLFAVSAYAFEPKALFSFALLGGLLAAIGVTLGVFVKMNRDAALNRIAGGEAGEVSFDRNFFNSVLTYVVLPVLGLVATQVPAVGQVANDWFRPLLRIVGLG